MASSAEGTHRHPSKPPGETPGETAQRARPPEGALGPWRKDFPFTPSLRRVPTPCAAPREAVTPERTPAPPVAAAPTLVSQHRRRPRHRPYTPAPPASSVTPPWPRRVGAGLRAGAALSASPLPGPPAPVKFSENDGSAFCVRPGPCPKHLAFRCPTDRPILGPGAPPAPRPTQRAAWSPPGLPLAQRVGQSLVPVR